MNFGTAVSTCLSKYATFSGRARRSEYWYFFLFNLLIGIVAAIVDRAVGNVIIGVLLTLAFILPGLAVGVRRLHDTNRSGFWYFIALIPLIGALVLLVFFASEGMPTENRYGPSPKQVAGGW